LEFITVPYGDIEYYDLVLPNISLVTKYPSNLPPEEQISFLRWKKTDQLNVCVMNDLYSETDYHANRDTQGTHTARKAASPLTFYLLEKSPISYLSSRFIAFAKAKRMTLIRACPCALRYASIEFAAIEMRLSYRKFYRRDNSGDLLKDESLRAKTYHVRRNIGQGV